MASDGTSYAITFARARTTVRGELANASIQFRGGVLDGLTLTGFTIWDLGGGIRSVTFPSWGVVIDGWRRSRELLRPSDAGTTPDEALRALILKAFTAYERADA